MSRWIELEAVFDKDISDYSLIVNVFETFGISSTLVKEDPFSIVGYLPMVSNYQYRLEELKDALIQVGASSFNSGKLNDDEWLQIIKDSFHPTRIGLNWYVAPSWNVGNPLYTDKVIILDPGSAFGMGDHPTTRMCLTYLEVLKVKGVAVVDVGCGSGILSIASKILGASNVVAIDNDAAAVQSARDNAHRNNVSYEVLLGCGLKTLPEKDRYSLIVSNISSWVLAEIAHEVHSKLYRNGNWLVSGIIQDRWKETLDAFEKASFKLVDKRCEGEWIAAVLQK